VSDLDAAVRAFVADTVLPQVEAWDRADDLPHAVLEQLVALGVTGALARPSLQERGQAPFLRKKGA
jgi:alkylation response protein AidB-like acyl-CoA dehydrogenase